MATKTVTSSELRTNIKRVLNEVEYGTENYIIEKFGEPSAAIISIEDFQFFQAISAILIGVEEKGMAQADLEQSEDEAYLRNTGTDGGAEGRKRKMLQKEMVESLMTLLEDSERIPDAALKYMENDLISKFLATLQYMDAQLSKLEAKMGINPEEGQGLAAAEELGSGPHSAHWGQFVGALADEEWERPAQGTLEARESW